MSRTCSTSSIQREVIQAKGHSGSNQKSAVTVDCSTTVLNRYNWRFSDDGAS